MWDLESYQEILREHAGSHHALGSALVLLVAICVVTLVLT